ncbi:16525_t:CDS:1, partial [Gigaspora margarita]
FMAIMHISQQSEYNIYNDSNLLAEVYSENDIERIESKVVNNLCAQTNVTCPILAGTHYTAQAHFLIPNDTKVVAVSVLTENDKYLGCELYIFHNITIPTLTTSIPNSTPHP